MTDYDLKEIVKTDSIYCSRAKKNIELTKARTECARENKCQGSCVLNVEFYLKAAARALGLCK